MKWLARLKNQKTLRADPTEPTKPGFVGFVGTPAGVLRNSTGAIAAANDSAPDPDRWCWPTSAAMNTGEIDTFTARLTLFTDKGLMLDDAEALADRLVIRDREMDDRRLCLECLHLAGYGAASWRCGNWEAAGVALRVRDAHLPCDLVCLMQRCDGFTRAIHTHYEGDHHGQA